MRKSFIGGAFILIGAGLIARLLGFIYRIYLSNLIGAEGMGLHQLIVPVYTAVVLTITSGVTIAVSKMIAEQKAKNNRASYGRITRSALVIVTAAGVIVSAIILFNADLVSIRILGDIRTRNSLLVLVPCLPAVVAAAALKGYFYGLQEVVPTAYSQIAEQTVKIVIIFLLSKDIIGEGAEYACTVATFSAAAGEIINLLVLYCAYRLKERGFVLHAGLGRIDIGTRVNGRAKIHLRKTHNGASRKGLTFKGAGVSAYMEAAGGTRKRNIVVEMLRCAVPVSANRMIISILSAAEHIMIPVMLSLGGLDDKSSMEIFGRLTGMVLPLILFPSLVTNSLATTLVPAISESVSLKNYRAVNYRISKSIQITFVLGIVFTALFFSYADEIGELVYRREKIGDILLMMSFSCVFVYLQQTLTGVLNGLGKQGVLLRNTIAGSLLRIGAVYFLIPIYGIRGYILVFTASLVIAESLNLFAINRITGLVLDIREWLLKPGLIGVIMVVIGRYLLYFYKIFFKEETVVTLLAIVTNVLAAAFFMVLTGVLKPRELISFYSRKQG